MKGILADANITGHVDALVRQMQSETWSVFWIALGLQFKRFEDLGLADDASDFEIWHACQRE